ncbi:MAG: sterol desaturase family protein [Candidatus Methylomirabilales bacterium]
MTGKHINEDGTVVYSGFWWKLALPVVILTINLGVVAGTYAWATSRPGSGWSALSIGVLFGVLVWTLFEYVLHRWLLHHTRHPLLRKIFWNGFHREHHMYLQMKDPDHHGIHIAITFPIILLLLGAVGLATESGWGLAILAGYLLGYCAYEAFHWLFHSGNLESGLGKLPPIHRLWAAHTVHHLHRADTNYGFITLFWDKRFHTYLPLDKTRTRKSQGARQ